MSTVSVMILISNGGDAGNRTRVQISHDTDIYILSHLLNLAVKQARQPANLTASLKITSCTHQTRVQPDPPKAASTANPGELVSAGCDSIN